MKKFIFSLVVIASVISVASPFILFAAAEENPGLPASLSTVFAKFPTFISKPLNSFFTTTETFRIDLRDTIGSNKAALQAEIQGQEAAVDKELALKEQADIDTYQKQTYVDSSNGNALHRAFLYILVFLYTALLFVVTSFFVFYGTGMVILFLILRWIWNHIL